MNDSDARNLCFDEFKERFVEYFVSFVCTLIINFINFGLKKLLQTVQDYGRYDSMTKQSLSLFDNLFISTFINTSFVITLVYSNIFDFIPMRVISIIIPNIFDTFTR